METKILKKDTLHKALLSLKKAIDQYDKACRLTECTDMCQLIFIDHIEIIRTMRDSMIQRFEYCVDSTWKYLKFYLEDIEKITLDLKSPRSVFKTLCSTRILSEAETEILLEMLDTRNATSHMYKETQADQLATKIHHYYKLLAALEHRI